MDSIISKTQFAFIPGRHLTDCSFIANEGINYLRKKNLKGAMFKIDFQRAYDSIDCSFWMFVMRKMGFGKRWCAWILKCISTASISILVNGSPTPQFSVAKGLRQGCSLSPLLFNLVGEALHLLLEKGAGVRLFSGWQIGRGKNVHSLCHLQFADDLTIFCGASIREVENVRRTLRVFEVASGLRLNLKKSSLFGVNVEDSLLELWAKKINCQVGKFPTVYLGLPLGPKSNSLALWEPVIESFYSHLATWKAKHLSISGRLVLIRSVLTALPSFFMSLYRMPAIVVNKISSIMAGFLWRDSTDGKRTHWVNWQSICQPSDVGGLKVKNLAIQNKALLGKWVWKFANDTNCPWREMMCCKYNINPATLIAHDKCQRSASWQWKSILKSTCGGDDFGTKLRNNLRLQVGDGKLISFWSELWIGAAPLREAFPRIYALARNKEGKISEMGCKVNNKWVWNVSLRMDPFDWKFPNGKIFWLALIILVRKVLQETAWCGRDHEMAHFR
ncbi:hypothetical protein HRI_004107000 [Hibiscus trionum]|uniref:Reverse transcriptase domain-containing protein n=1 Tax=Hibiscus trionum TaxID=183268 RepID=A0A9W7J0U5_HIBTR|nr:hypothetical protein HRI_004107000 [Hibiscus trionum]